jgi:hypothetical protein
LDCGLQDPDSYDFKFPFSWAIHAADITSLEQKDLAPDEQKDHQFFVDSMNWAANATKPDIFSAISYLSSREVRDYKKL